MFEQSIHIESLRGLKIALLLAALAGTATLVEPTLAEPGQGNHFDRRNPQVNQALLRADASQHQAIAAQYGLSIVGRHGDLALVEGPGSMTAEQLTELLTGDPRLTAIEPALQARLPASADGGSEREDSGSLAPDLLRLGSAATPCTSQLVNTPLWSGYADQSAGDRIHLDEAQQAAADCGAITVALLDTGVDPDHPVLQGALLPGFDFLSDTPGTASEFLDQSVMPIVEHTLITVAGMSAAAVAAGNAQPLELGTTMAVLVAPSSAAQLSSQDLPAFFGHGTMVAGIVRLTAPGARILPLRVFNSEGQGHVFDIVRAIYYAVAQGAEVISMSFSVAESSAELRRAVQYARGQGVTCVAAAGNQGERVLVYPAALADAIGVTSTTQNDQLSGFSNFGAALVDLSAPGSAVISTYPGGLYAAGWGTSFSTPFVAGTLALLHNLVDPGPTARQSRINALLSGAERIPGLAGDIGRGRLDAQAAVLAASP